MIWPLLILTAALAAPAAANLNHHIPRNALKRRTDHAAEAPPPPFVPLQDEEQHEYLRAHNRHRRRHDIAPLSWDPHLAAAAHAWAVERRGDCDYRHHSKNPYGENIYWKSANEFNPKDVVQFWYDEKRNYDNKTMSCKCHPERENCECGHYLNVIWSTTRRFGCSGSVYCDDQNGVYVVCNYDPPGRTPGINPFTGAKLPGYRHH